MKLSEKIQFLRNKNGMSQELLAEKCFVTRQSISKWEMDISLPDVDNLLVLSKLFGVPVDVLLKDDLCIDGVKENKTCGILAGNETEGIYEGLLIKEGIDDESIIDCLNIHKVELWKTSSYPRYWTAITFTSSVMDLPERMSKVMVADEKRGGNWYVDFKKKNTKYIVFKGLVLKYEIGNSKEKTAVIDKCRDKGIPDNQMDWAE